MCFVNAYLAPNQHCAEHNLQPIEEIVSNNDDLSATNGPSLSRRYGLNAWRGDRHWWIETCEFNGISIDESMLINHNYANNVKYVQTKFS